MCRDCRGLQPLFRNVMCVACCRGSFWVGLESRLACNFSGENVNKSPVLTSVRHVCCQTGASVVFRVTHAFGPSAESHQPLSNSVFNNRASDEAREHGKTTFIPTTKYL